MQSLYNQISGRGPFSYDATKDPLFQGYKNSYVQQGKLAMKDTIGQAAALTGGYGNTYGQQVGQQAYDAYLQNLGDVIPQMYSMAYQQYQDQGDALLRQYGMLGDMRDRDYNLYRDAVGDWQRNAEFLHQLDQDDYNRQHQQEVWQHQLAMDAYQQQQDAQQFAFQQAQWQHQVAQDAYNQQHQQEVWEYQQQQDAQQWAHTMEQWEYQQQQDAQRWSAQQQQQAYNSLYALISSSGYNPSPEELQAAGMSFEAAQAIANEYWRQVAEDEERLAMAQYSTYNSGSGGGYSGGGYSGGGYSAPYSGDIWQEAYDYSSQYGGSAGMGALSSAYIDGAITGQQYVIGEAGIASAGIADYANTLNQMADERRRRKN
jgi:hypothetical protein